MDVTTLCIRICVTCTIDNIFIRCILVYTYISTWICTITCVILTVTTTEYTFNLVCT